MYGLARSARTEKDARAHQHRAQRLLDDGDLILTAAPGVAQKEVEGPLGRQREDGRLPGAHEPQQVLVALPPPPGQPHRRATQHEDQQHAREDGDKDDEELGDKTEL